MSDDSDARVKQLVRSRRGGKIGGPARARALTPKQRSEIAKLGAAARARKYHRPALAELSGKELLNLLVAETQRSFTKPELRKILRSCGYKLDRSSKRYWHPKISGWIAVPAGKSGIIPKHVAAMLLGPLLDSVQKSQSAGIAPVE